MIAATAHISYYDIEDTQTAMAEVDGWTEWTVQQSEAVAVAACCIDGKDYDDDDILLDDEVAYDKWTTSILITGFRNQFNNLPFKTQCKRRHWAGFT